MLNNLTASHSHLRFTEIYIALKGSLPQMSKNFGLRRVFDQTRCTVKENFKSRGPIIDVYTDAPADVVTVLL